MDVLRINKLQSTIQALRKELKDEKKPEKEALALDAIILSIKPKWAKEIREETKNHEFRKYLLPAKEAWLYETEPVNALTTVAYLDKPIEKGKEKIQDSTGTGNDEFNRGEKESRYAYPITGFRELSPPLDADTLQQEHGIMEPRRYCDLPQKIADKYPKPEVQRYRTAEETIEEICIRPMMEALDLLQDYDIYGLHTSKISPTLIMQLRNMTPKEAVDWLTTNFTSKTTNV